VAEAIVVVVTAIVIVYYVQFRKLTLVCVTVIYLFVIYLCCICNWPCGC
jgi:hypothetical protein